MTSSVPELGFAAPERLLAASLAGDERASRQLAALDADGALARRHRAGAALYLRAAAAGLEAPARRAWHGELHHGAARVLVYERELAMIAGVLAAAGVAWMPFKGIDLASRVYGVPEERPISDIDLLIGPRDLEKARAALTEAGWRDLAAGPRDRRFLVEEGYAWRAVGLSGVLLELHFRLWGVVPEALPAAIFERAEKDPTIHGGRRPLLADAYLIAAVHVWLDPPPRSPVRFWDLAQIARCVAEHGKIETAASRLTEMARRFDLQLPLLLASEVSATLWEKKLCRRLALDLEETLRWPERRVWKRAARRGGLSRLPLAELQLARLLAGRRARMRLRAVWRRLWPHPGIVERATPEEWGWWRRRLWFQFRR